ncbi:MAG: DUF4262 domain-containing protein [Acidimicrobiales bacterium]|nr:DUF4262 domain-containing protein [Acidimicrobiales bacterium]
MTSSGAASIDCRCRLCEPDADVHDDEQETRALDIIGRHGWLVTAIEAADGIPGWAFTTGLTHSFGWPELAMTGLPTATLHACLNEVAGRARDGVPYVDGARLGDVLEGYDVELRSADLIWNYSLFGWSRWFAQHVEPRFAQVVWPDRAGRFPADEGFDQALAHLQPRLGVPPRHHDPGPWRAWAADSVWPGREASNRMVLVSRSVVEAGAPVLSVTFDDDGDWSFTDSTDTDDASDVALAHLFHLLMDDPSLDQHMGLQRGQTAWRASVEAPWQVSDSADGGGSHG